MPKNLRARPASAVFVVLAVLLSSTAGAMLVAGHSSAAPGPTAAPRSRGATTPATCDNGCGGSGGGSGFGYVTLNITVSGVPAYSPSGYPVSVPFNLAFIDSGGSSGTQTDVTEVPVASGMDLEEPNGPNGFMGSFNAHECDLLQPENACYNQLSTLIEDSGNFSFYDQVGAQPYDAEFGYHPYASSPYYYDPSDTSFHFITSCDAFPHGHLDITGKGNVTAYIDLVYQDCRGYNYGNSGFTGTGATHVNATKFAFPYGEAAFWKAFWNWTDANFWLSDTGPVTNPNGTPCATCQLISGTTIGLVPSEMTNASGGPVALNISLALPPGNYSGRLSLYDAAFDAAPGRQGLTPGGEFAWTGPLDISANRTTTVYGTLERTYPVTLEPSGLPTGLPWNATVSSASLQSHVRPGVDETATPFPLVDWGIQLPNGTYGLTGSAPGYLFAGPGGTNASSFAVNGTELNVSLPFSGPSVYAAGVSTSGLPAGTVVHYTFRHCWPSLFAGPAAGSTGDTPITVYLTNGTCTVSATAGSWYGAAAPSLNVTTAGSGQILSFAFGAVPTQSVVFHARGLPHGEAWGISLGDPAHNVTSTTGSLTLAVTATLLDSSVCPGNFTTIRPVGYVLERVLGCSPTSTKVTLRFAPVAPLSFVGVGQPSSLPWYVCLTLAGKGGAVTVPCAAPTGATVQFFVPVGHYRFTVPSNWTYRAHPQHGGVGVPAAGHTKTIHFKPVTQRVIFTEKGLPFGTNWCVHLTGPVNQSTCTSHGRMVLHLVNGTYDWAVSPVSGYTATASTGQFKVAAAGSSQPPENVVLNWTKA